jgi:hypothetical protein
VVSSPRCVGSARRTSRIACRGSFRVPRTTFLTSPTRWWTSFSLGLSFEAFEGPGYATAVELARLSPGYREEDSHGSLVHHAEFDPGAARTLRDLFDLVGRQPGTEVRVDGKRAPYGHELWLPLFWIFVGGEA